MLDEQEVQDMYEEERRTYQMARLLTGWRGRAAGEVARIDEGWVAQDGENCRLLWFPDGERLYAPVSRFEAYACAHLGYHGVPDGGRCPDCNQWTGACTCSGAETGCAHAEWCPAGKGA